MKEDFLSERNRAEDIILGTLGFGEDASIISISFTESGFYKGIGRWADGETFEFGSEDVPGELEMWALKILGAKKVSNAA